MLICSMCIRVVSAVAECKECFTLFDKNGDGRIAVNDLGTVVRSLGMNPTESEVREVVRSTLRKCTLSASLPVIIKCDGSCVEQRFNA